LFWVKRSLVNKGIQLDISRIFAFITLINLFYHYFLND
jgi:hypothetical protein